MAQEEQVKVVTDRLDRFEAAVTSKLDLLTDALIKLARTEEKILAIENDRLAQQQRISEQNKKIEIIEDKLNTNTSVINNISKFFWITVAALASTGIGILATLIT